LKNLLQKRAGGAAQGEGPEFKPQSHKAKQKTTRTTIKLCLASLVAQACSPSTWEVEIGGSQAQSWPAL
jgi:hypothetical protein